MKKILRVLSILTFIISLSTSVLAEMYSSISGKIIDKTTNKGIEGAFICIKDNIKMNSRSDKGGNYVINGLTEGNYSIVVEPPLNSIINYKPEKRKINVSITTGENLTEVNYYLKKMGSISGKLYQSDGVTPIINGEVFAYYLGRCCLA